VRIGGHAFDYASADRLVLIEVNGCYWHDHRSVDPACKAQGRTGAVAKDERVRSIAARAGAVLVELWECQEARWPQHLAATTLIGG
jgi:G:T-mismatch repair DNA endonuclease (very short patch repair protein)